MTPRKPESTRPVRPSARIRSARATARAHPHLQLPAGARHRSPHQSDALQSAQGDGSEALGEIINALITEHQAELLAAEGN
jgi:hypothetical protein